MNNQQNIYQFSLETEGAAIYSKIDWYTAIFNDMSMHTVLEWLRLDSYLLDFAERIYEACAGLENHYVFSACGVRLEVNQYSFYGSVDSEGTCDVSLFDRIVPKIRLDISGSGLDQLRSLGAIDPDVYLRTFEGMPQPSHVTRIDFAFDLVNYRPDFLQKVVDHCERWHTPSDRICISGTEGGIKYSIRKGSQLSVYLGASSSKKMLRIYDKRLQFTNAENTIYVKDNPYGNPDSWIRLELQCRREIAHGLCFPENEDLNLLTILKYIYKEFNFADVEHTSKQNRRPVEFWSNLFDWDLIPMIIQNLYFVEVKSSRDLVLSSFYNRGARNVLDMISIYGFDGLMSHLANYVSMVNAMDTPERARRKQCIVARFCDLGVDVTRTDYGWHTDGKGNLVLIWDGKIVKWDDSDDLVDGEGGDQE